GGGGERLKSAAEELAKRPPRDAAAQEGHAGRLATRSTRPLVRRLDLAALPPVRADGPNPLPWAVITETTLDRNFRPTFHKRLKALDVKTVALTGVLITLGHALES